MTLVEERPVASEDHHIKEFPLRERYLAAILSDRSGVDMAEFLFRDHGTSDGCFRVWPFQFPWFRSEHKQVIDQCVAAGQRVRTRLGDIRIEDIRLGDEVLTHRGRWRPVTAVWDRGEHEVVTLTDERGRRLTVTHGHRIYGCRDAASELEWIDAEKFSDPDMHWSVADIESQGVWLFEVTDVAEAGTARVFDLEVEDDDSFIVNDVVVHNCSRDVGKALAVTTPIPTPDGWKMMGELEVGDKVYADDGSVCNVTEVFAVMRDRPCFEVEFEDGSVIIADADHNWLTWSKTNVRHRGRRRPTRCRWPEIHTTEQIAASLRFDHQHNHRVPVAGALSGEERIFEITPYALGAWLGDGSSYRGHMTIGPEDEAEMTALLRAEGLLVEKLTSRMAWSLKFPGKVNHKTGTVTAALRRLGVRANKHIPVAYLRASVEQRLALLQGLMDTDGHATKSYGRCEITLANERLARDVEELLVSLGQKTYFSKKNAHCNGVDAGPVYRVGFQPNGIVPFRLSRKVARLQDRRVNPSLLGQRAIVDVREVPSVPVRCIAVDSPRHLFLAGPTMIPTHNSERIVLRSCAFPFNFPQQEHALVAPEGSHIKKLTERIEGRIRDVRLLREMIIGGMNGINHNPFHITWKTAAQTYSVIPQRTGLGIKGIHCARLDVDEAQDIPERAWMEMPLTVRFDTIEGATWNCHGVSKGVHDQFWKITQPNSGWVVYTFTQLHKPSYDKSARPQLVKNHGGSDTSGDFLRNVYGMHGDTQDRIFVLAHFMAMVDNRAVGSAVNDEYYQPIIIADEIAARLGDKVAVESSSEDATSVLLSMLELPIMHRSNYDVFWMGMDVGIVGDPTEICILAEYMPDAKERKELRANAIAVPDEGVSRFRLVTRVRLLQIPTPMQADVVMRLIEFYGPQVFAQDAGGNGIGVFQELQKRAGTSRVMAVEPPQLAQDASDADKAQWALDMAAFEERRKQAKAALTAIKGYKFGQKLVVDFDETKVAELVNPSMEDMVDKAGITQESKTRATDVLRTIVDDRRFLFPNDDEFIDQMNGQTFTYRNQPIDAYGKRVASYSIGQFHILDAMRFFALGWSQEQIEKILAAQPAKQAPVIDRFVRIG